MDFENTKIYVKYYHLTEKLRLNVKKEIESVTVK